MYLRPNFRYSSLDITNPDKEGISNLVYDCPKSTKSRHNCSNKIILPILLG